jgi:hypothetical protein
MKIKEFFENCVHCYHVWIFVFREGYQLDALGIYTHEDLDNFINDYGEEKIKDWTVRECEVGAEITFYLK